MDELQILSDCLSQLTQIKWIFVSILIIFILGLIGICIVTFRMKKAVDEDMGVHTFREKTNAMLDKDDLDGVIKSCEEKLKEYPKDMYAHWYLSQAYYRKKEYHKALEKLTIISENRPSWREDYVEPYIEEIKEKLQTLKPEIVKD